MGNTWLGMYFPNQIRERLPNVEVILRSSKTGIPLEDRKEYIVTKHVTLGERVFTALCVWGGVDLFLHTCQEIHTLFVFCIYSAVKS